MNYTLFDDHLIDHLLPLTFTRPASELRIGILTIREKWEKQLSVEINSWKTRDYLSAKYPLSAEGPVVFLNGHCCPTPVLASQVRALMPGEGICFGQTVVAVCVSEVAGFNTETLPLLKWTESVDEPTVIERPWHMFAFNGKELDRDFLLLTSGRKSVPVPASVQVLGAEQIFIEEGARLNFAVINAEKGPVYIGRDAEVMEGSLIRGPFALCEGSTVNMGAKIYGPTTIGPHSKVGGELNNVVIQAYSNKGHDGFLGNSVIGEWCNLGADTNSSNLKNDYTEVKLWNYPTGRFQKTGLQFCGLIMGDHSKCGINTMFNSGTVIGVACNIHGTGYPRNFVPSFSNGGAQGYQLHSLKMVFTTAEKAMSRRGISLTDDDKQILSHIFGITSKYRQY